MEGTDNISVAKIQLQRAAKLLEENSKHSGSIPPDIEVYALIHQLEVHQIELEMINDELQAEKEHAEAVSEKYVELYDFAPSGYFTINKTGQIIDLNLSAAGLLEKDRSSLKNNLFAYYVSAETKTIFNDFLKNIFSGSKKETCEIALLSASNKAKYVHLSGIINTNEEQCYVSAVDITQRKQMEIELLEKEVQYENLADAGLALIWSSETDGMRTYFNQPWFHFTGKTPEQEMGKGWMTGIHPDDLDNYEKNVLAAFKNKTSYSIEFRLLHSSGEYRWILEKATPNYKMSLRFLGYIGQCMDISELNKLRKLSI
ncbi:MAG: PAS domain-containing protein [Prolixibacteraceae bacterium]